MIEISPQEAQARVASGAYLLDVREQNEWDEVHAQGAHLIPLSEFTQRYTELPKESEIVVICRSGARSGQAAQFLEQQGYHAVNLEGGTLRWLEEGLPVERSGV
jgi:rhodanese-related sulfurtransferase